MNELDVRVLKSVATSARGTTDILRYLPCFDAIDVCNSIFRMKEGEMIVLVENMYAITALGKEELVFWALSTGDKTAPVLATETGLSTVDVALALVGLVNKRRVCECSYGQTRVLFSVQKPSGEDGGM